MSLIRRTGLTRPVTLTIASVAIGALAFVTASSADARTVAAAPDRGALYIVQTAGAPLATYTGNVAGIPATKPADGAKLNPRAWNYGAYRNYLRAQRSTVMQHASVDSSKKLRDYDVAFNGFAARLTKTEAARLESTPGVVKVWKNTIHHIDTISTPSFLGLDGPNGVWQQQFGGVEHAGEGVIVGDIDTGFWPENPSLGPLPEPRPDQAIIDSKFFGTCVAGDDHPVTCNNKVIGARFYNAAGLGDNDPREFHSPRDFDGHGTHTATTAAGDNGVTATINGNVVGKVSGMAPAARIADYKALWEQPGAAGTASGSDVDLVNAIDDATGDGVDVINFSIGDNVDGFGLEELAFLNAAAAGVFVSAAAGNAGPGASTVDNAMPWETTAAAGTHDRSFSKTVTLGNGQTFTGVGVGAAVPSSGLVDALKSGLSTAAPGDAELCVLGTLDPAKVTGKMQARRERPHGQEQGGAAGRRRRHDPVQRDAQQPERRLPLRADGARGPGRGCRHQGVPRERGCRGDRLGERGRTGQGRGAGCCRVLVPRPVREQQR